MRTAGRVLLIERDRSSRLESALQNTGFETKVVTDPKDAVRAVHAFAPSAILLTAIPPELDGLTILAELRRATDAPIVIVGGRADSEQAVEILARGADDYVPEFTQLSEVVARIVAKLRRPGITKAPA